MPLLEVSRSLQSAISAAHEEFAHSGSSEGLEAKLFGLSLLARLEAEHREFDSYTVDLWLGELASHDHLADYRKIINVAWSYILRHASSLSTGDLEALLLRRDRLIAIVEAGEPSPEGNRFAARFAAVKALESLLSTYAPNQSSDVDRVGYTSALISHAIALPADEVANVHTAALVRDIGMVMIPRKVLDTKGPLSEDDRRMVERHVEFSVDIVRAVGPLRDCVPMVAAHHERYDGTGYPGNLRGEAIPMGARIVALSNAVQAMLAPRPWRPARTATEVRETLWQESGGQWDPQLTEIAIELIDGGQIKAPVPDIDVVVA